MKKIFGLVMSIIVGIFSVSCKSNTPPDPHSGSIKSYDYELKQTGEILSELIVYFDEKDKESIKSMFSPYAQQTYDLDLQIEKVFEIYDGKSTSFEIRNGSELTKDVKNGKYVELSYYGLIDNIYTDNYKSFKIKIQRCAVDDRDPNLIGLNQITLCKSDGTRLAPIGAFGNEEYYG